MHKPLAALLLFSLLAGCARQLPVEPITTPVVTPKPVAQAAPPVQPQPRGHGQHGFHIGVRGQKIFLGLEAFGRQAFSVPRHVEGKELMVLRQSRIVQDMPPLARIGPCGVQA